MGPAVVTLMGAAMVAGFVARENASDGFASASRGDSGGESDGNDGDVSTTVGDDPGDESDSGEDGGESGAVPNPDFGAGEDDDGGFPSTWCSYFEPSDPRRSLVLVLDRSAHLSGAGSPSWNELRDAVDAFAGNRAHEIRLGVHTFPGASGICVELA